MHKNQQNVNHDNHIKPVKVMLFIGLLYNYHTIEMM